MSVVSMVVGAATASQARVVTKVDSGADVRLLVADNAGLSGGEFFGPVTPGTDNVASIAATGLDPDVQYHWAVEHGGVVDTTFSAGRFRTDPPLGEPASFEVAVIADAGATPEFPGVGSVLAAERMSNHPAFGIVRRRRPRRVIHAGDLHYYDLTSGSWGIVGGASLANYRRAYDDVMLQPEQHQLYREAPWVYGPDDHCAYGNDLRGAEVPTAAVNCLQVYGERVPHYPLPNPTVGWYQWWQIGRVLFVLLDGRSQASANSDIDGPAKTMLGSTQKAWLDSLLASSDAEFLVLITGSQWTLTTHDDSWASFATERAELVTMFGDHGWLKKMCCVYPDRHALGLDTGSHNAHGGFPLMMAASIDATPSQPASDRFDLGRDAPGRNQYGTVSVNDWGHGMTVTLAGWQGEALWRSHTIGVNVSSPLTAALSRAVSKSHTARFEAKVIETFQTGGEPTGTEIPILGGDVKLDGTAEIQRTLELDTSEEFPRGRDNLLAPTGNEVFVRRGVDLGRDGTAWVPLGYFRIDDSEQDRSPDGPIRLSCSDRMAGIVDGRLLTPIQFSADRTVGSVFAELVREIYPDAAVVFDDNTHQQLLGREMVAEEERYEFLNDLATSRGKIMYWDGSGMLQVTSLPDPSEIAWEVAAGEDGVLIEASRRLSREGVYNAVVAMGEGADEAEPARGIAFDNNPNSPTYWHGRFGKVPRFYASPFITNGSQALSAAQSLLRRSIGLPYSADFTAVPNPALTPYLAVRVTQEDGSRDTHVLQTLTIPLTVAANLAATTKEQTLVVLGSLS